MDTDGFLESVESENQTALSRLGSSKALYAATAGEMNADTVVAAAADAEYAARETFQEWAEDESNARAREVFAETAEEEAGHYDAVLAELGDHDPDPDAVPAIHDHLRGLETTIDRAAGLVGRTLASARSKDQFTGYFVGQADPQTASLFRGFGDDLDAQLERGLDLLEAICESEEDRERAREVAGETIQTAYEEHVATLEGMGVDPKPVC